MQFRKDGEETRRRVLESACQVFGEKGYRDATNADICKLAGANIAAINYHFGSKADLYKAAWQQAVDLADRLYPIDGGVPSDAPASHRLGGYIHSLLKRLSDKETLAHFHCIRMSELVNPTGLLDSIIQKNLLKGRSLVTGIIRELLGSEVPGRTVRMCEMSIISQCFWPPSVRYRSCKHHFHTTFFEIDCEERAEHILRFCLAGIEAARRYIECGSRTNV